MDAAAATEIPAGVGICSLSELGEADGRAVTVGLAKRKVHGFVVRRVDSVFGYAARCLHAGWPITAKGGRFVSRDGSFISCTWPGAFLALESGACAGGPCLGHRPAPWAVAVVGDWIVTL